VILQDRGIKGLQYVDEESRLAAICEIVHKGKIALF